MNRHFYRVVFNAARGIRMVVQETASSAGKGASRATTVVLGGALVVLVGGTAAQAQIVGAPNVPGHLRPTVITAPNGVPLVQIQTPSAAGVSRNIYNQFNVATPGAILNNSRKDVQSQLGGWVQGNPYLATGPARIILNEVNSGNPSQLRGYIEVAGARAEVIIANPAGISVDGAGFINASRATLTTGTPQLNAIGGLEQFLVRGGTVRIEGAGLDTRQTDYAAILARAVEANAGIWAGELKVVAGAGDISADYTQIAPAQGTGPAPTFSLDVAALGGMYTGKITLVGTEAGLGVRNAGTVQATGAGGLVVTADGRLENTGTLQATASSELRTRSLANSGSIASGGHLGIATQDTLANTDGGTLAAAHLELASSAGDIDNRGGTIRQTSSAAMNIAAARLSNTAGGVIGLEPVAQAPSPGTGTGGTGAGTAPPTPAPTPTPEGPAASGEPITPAPYVPPSPGTLTADSAILNDGGKIYAGGAIDLQSADIDNSGGSLSLARMAVTQPRFSNRGGTLNIANGFSADVDRFDNTEGKLNAGSLAITTTGDFLNIDGTLASASDANLTIGGAADNTRGTVSAADALTMNVAGDADNTAGTLVANQAVTFAAGSLTNTGGNIQSVQAGVEANVAGWLDNGKGGAIGAATDLNLQAGLLANAGNLRAGNDVDVRVNGAMTQAGSLTAGRNATVTAASLNAGRDSVLGAGVQNDGSLGTAGDLRITTTGALAAAGQNLAAGNATLQGASVDLSASQTSAQNIAITATKGDLSSNKAQITAQGTLDIGTEGTATNLGGVLAAQGATTVTAASLDNTDGTLASSAGDLRVTTHGITTNKAGRMLAAGPITLANSGFSNTEGLVSGQRLALDTQRGPLDNTRGTLIAERALDLNSGALVNHSGLVQSGGAMAIDTHGQSLTNTGAAGHATGAGGIVSADSLRIITGTAGGTFGRVENGAGFIGAQRALGVDAGEFANGDGGLVFGQAALAIDTHGGAYDNSGGQTLAVGDMLLKAGAVQNQAGLIRSTATTTLDAGSIDNSRSSGEAQGIEGLNVAMATASLTNAAGAIRAERNATLTVGQRIDNGFDGSISAGHTLSITDPNTANKTLALVNDGTLFAGKALTVEAASLASGGRLLSGEDMRIGLSRQAVFAAGSQTIANRDLTIDTEADLASSGRVAAGRALSLSGQRIDNTATGDIQGATTRISARDKVTNRGLIDGVTTRIDASTVENIGTGRIYGDHVAIGATTLNNLAETIGGIQRAATIAARRRLDIGTATLDNRDGGLIFSDGDLFIGGSLDAEGHATGSASTVNNHAATIEATRNAEVKTRWLGNTNGGVSWTLEPGSSERVVEYAVPGSAVRYPASDVLFAFGGYRGSPDKAWAGWSGVPATEPQGLGRNAGTGLLIPSPDYPLEKFRPYYLRSPAHSADRSEKYCGNGSEDAVCTWEPVAGEWYSRTDPIWADFGVTPPNEDLPADFIGRLHPDITVGQQGILVTVDDEVPRQEIAPFDHPVTQAEYDRWQAYRSAHQKLDEATLDFIYKVTGSTRNPKYNSRRISSIFDAFDYTDTTSTPVLQSSAPARLLAGNALKIEVGGGINDQSQILAGGDLSVTGGQIADVGLAVDAPTVRTGVAIHSYINEHTFGSDERVYQHAPYNSTTNTTVTLQAARQQGHASFDARGADAGSVSTGQTGATAPAPGSVAADLRVHPIIEIPAASQPDKTTGTTAPSATVVRTSVPRTSVPTASLFTQRPDPASRYLVETDPRFADHRQWLSSDYLLERLGHDPATALKRLGDGFYEQRLVREQVAQLTGFRLLDGFASDEAQYTALMTAGATFAQAHGLRPGIALTDAQMAQLTSDIVWLVEQTVPLADGSTQRVLVPQVYVRVKEGDIDGSGALLSGGSVNMQLAGDLATDGGTIAGRRAVVLSAQNIHNLGGRITGDDVRLAAREDINVIGATVDARSRLAAVAGRDLNVVTTTREATSTVGALPRSDASSGVDLSAVTLDRIAGLYVTNPGGSLVAVAGRDMTLAGADIRSEGDATLAAGRHLNLDSVATSRSEDIRWSSRNARSEERSEETGTTVHGAGDVTMTAGGDLTGRAAGLFAGKTLDLEAGGRLTLYAGENSTSADTRHSTRKGLSYSGLDADSQDTTLARTTLAAKDIKLKSGADMTLGAIQADGESLDIDAGGKLNMLVQKTTSAKSFRKKDGDGAWVSADGAGQSDETSQYSVLNAPKLSIQARGGITTQLGQTASLTDLARQPGMAWVGQLANDPAFANSVEWQRVQEAHEQWAYSQTSLGPVAALVVSVVVGVATAGAGTAVMGSSAAAYPATTAAIQAGITTMASQATVSVVNNEGDLGKVLKEMGSSDSVKRIATAMATAGVVQGLGSSGVLPQNIANATNGSALFTDQLQRQLIDGVASSVVRSAINGTSLEDELRSGLVNALLNTVAAQGANWIGQNGPQGNANLNAFAAEAAHAIAGCAVGAARAGSGDGCAPGAIGGVIGHLTGQFLNPNGDPSRAMETIAFSQLVGSLAAAAAGGDDQAVYIAAGAAGNAVENNWLSQKRPNLLTLSEQEKYDAAASACGAGDKAACDTRNQLAQLSATRDAPLRDACVSNGGSQACLTEVQRAQAAGNRVFVDGQGNITVNGVAFAAAGPVTSPYTTSTAGQMAQSTAEGLVLEAGNQVAAPLMAPLARWLGQGVTSVAEWTAGVENIKRISASGAEVIAQYGPLSAGPLPSSIANTFRSGTYAEVIVMQPTILYRSYGGTAKQIGGYWTRIKPTGPVQSILDSALDPKWGNNAANFVAIKIPAGTRIFEGSTASQSGLVGGGNQILFRRNLK